MYIGSIDIGKRSSTGVVDAPRRWLTAGVSMAGVVTVRDFGKKEQDISVTKILPTATKDTLKAYLVDTIKEWGSVSVTPDAGDDLQIGATGATALTFISFSASYLSNNWWNVEILFRKYS